MHINNVCDFSFCYKTEILSTFPTEKWSRNLTSTIPTTVMFQDLIQSQDNNQKKKEKSRINIPHTEVFLTQ